MRLVLNYFFTLSFGILLALGIAKVVGIIFPTIEMWLFIFLSVCWLIIGWRHSTAMNKLNKLKIPDGCDLLLAREEIKEAFYIANKKSENNSGGNYFQQDLVEAWYSFRDNPSLVTANKLLLIAPMLHKYFVESSPGGEFYIYNSIKKIKK